MEKFESHVRVIVEGPVAIFLNLPIHFSIFKPQSLVEFVLGNVLTVMVGSPSQFTGLTSTECMVGNPAIHARRSAMASGTMRVARCTVCECMFWDHFKQREPNECIKQGIRWSGGRKIAA